jgi:hypothetical protein
MLIDKKASLDGLYNQWRPFMVMAMESAALEWKTMAADEIMYQFGRAGGNKERLAAIKRMLAVVFLTHWAEQADQADQAHAPQQRAAPGPEIEPALPPGSPVLLTNVQITPGPDTLFYSTPRIILAGNLGSREEMATIRFGQEDDDGGGQTLKRSRPEDDDDEPKDAVSPPPRQRMRRDAPEAPGLMSSAHSPFPAEFTRLAGIPVPPLPAGGGQLLPPETSSPFEIDWDVSLGFLGTPDGSLAPGYDASLSIAPFDNPPPLPMPTTPPKRTASLYSTGALSPDNNFLDFIAFEEADSLLDTLTPESRRATLDPAASASSSPPPTRSGTSLRCGTCGLGATHMNSAGYYCRAHADGDETSDSA